MNSVGFMFCLMFCSVMKYVNMEGFFLYVVFGCIGCCVDFGLFINVASSTSFVFASYIVVSVFFIDVMYFCSVVCMGVLYVSFKFYLFFL